MKVSKYILLLLLFVSISPAFAQVSGIVYQDFNASGSRQNTASYAEPGMVGVTVTGYGANGTVYGPVSTASNGTYTLSGVNQPTRIEFSWANTFLRPGPAGATTVQFVSGAASNVNLGVSFPTDYCDSQNPPLFITCFVNGDGQGGGVGSNDAMVYLNYQDQHNENDISNPSPSLIATAAEIGSAWAAKYVSTNQKVYVAAVLKRHSGFGLLGPGGIYQVDVTNPNSPSVSPWLTIPSAGIDPRIANPLPSGLNSPSRDLVAYQTAGKMSLGGMAISDDKKTMYVMNLNTKSLVFIDIASQNITSTIPATYAGACSTFRPWAVSILRGELYISGVCTQEGSNNTPTGHILKYNGTGFDQVFSFSFGYNRDSPVFAPGSNSCPTDWHAWDSDPNNFPDPGCASSNNAQQIFYQQPIIADVEIDTDGSLVIGVIDRFNLMTGSLNWHPSQNDGESYSGIVAGDILRACVSGTGWVFEGSGACPNPGAGEEEYYGGDFFSSDGNDPFDFTHGETSMGGIGLLKGTGDVTMASMDPINNTTQSFGTGGIKWLDNSDGYENRAYKIYSGSGISKSYGLGEPVFKCASAPVEIGNRVWIDLNEDGVQGADETPVSGVNMQLYADFDENGSPDNASPIATTTTNGDGNWYFNISNVPGGLQFDQGYVVQVDASQFNNGGLGILDQYSLTNANVGGAGQPDARDSDANLVGGLVQIPLVVGQAGFNNHTYDIGFVLPPPCEITGLSVQNYECLDNNSPSLMTDNRLRFGLFVANTNPSFTSYSISVNGNTTTITPTTGTYGAGVFTLGAGTGGSGATYYFTITDIVTGAACTANVQVTSPADNCVPGIECPTPSCGVANIQVNGN